MLRRFNFEFELSGASEEGSSYLVTAPDEFSTNRALRELAALARKLKGAVAWKENVKNQSS